MGSFVGNGVGNLYRWCQSIQNAIGLTLPNYSARSFFQIEPSIRSPYILSIADSTSTSAIEAFQILNSGAELYFKAYRSP